MADLRVTCALIEEDSRILLAQRASDKAQGGKWEFPGGKIDGGESPEACLRREIREELGCEIAVGDALTPVEHVYAWGRITLIPFRCRIQKGRPQALEHAAITWTVAARLPEFDLAEADRPVVQEYLALLEAG
jgi:8-oxo-dGTP diphosphatase